MLAMWEWEVGGRPEALRVTAARVVVAGTHGHARRQENQHYQALGDILFLSLYIANLAKPLSIMM